MKPIRMYLNGIAFQGPGIESWAALNRAFETDHYTPPDSWQASPACLSPRAARRVSPQIRLALAVAEQIAPALPEDAAWIFASSTGEGETLKVNLEALRDAQMMIQPLRFQNAVHNAASGQWSIAAKVTAPITSIAAHDQTVGAGLIKAGIQLAFERRAVGVVCYDVPLPEPLDAKRPLGLALGAGLALSPTPGPTTLAEIDLGLAEEAVTAPAHRLSRTLAESGNPVAALLPLFERIGRRVLGHIVIAVHGGCALGLHVRPQ